MARNYLIFFFGLVIIFAFSFFFCFEGIYAQSLMAGVLAIIGFAAALIISLVIGIASREEGGSLYVWFFAVSIVTAIVFIWYLSRAGTLLQIW
jgi:hypothetical protein